MSQEIGLPAAREFLAELVQCRHVSELLDALDAFLKDRPHSMGLGVWLLRPDESPPVLQLLRLCRPALRPPATWRDAWGTYERVPLDEPILGQVCRSATPRITSTTTGWTPPPWAAEQGVSAYASIPVVHRGERLGVICNFLRWGVLPEQMDESLFLMHVLALHIGATLANERAMDEVERARRALELENRSLREEVREARGLDELLGDSPAMRSCLEQVRLVADTDAPVLLLGETGTGKELVAQAIHTKSHRAQHALIRVNCPSIPTSLFESEFFGHVRGAFTSAAQDRIGRFQLADKGTLFLDEISEVPLELQSKLLRVLQMGTFERVGDDRSRQVDVRIVAASNRNLAAEAAAGRFRLDLFYRLNVFPISLPPLRERAGDVELLATHFFAAACNAAGVRGAALTEQHLERLRRYSWPGNVRELRNAMERLAILSRRGAPGPEALHFLAPAPPPSTTPLPPTPLAAAPVAEAPPVAPPAPKRRATGTPQALSEEQRQLERQRIEEALRDAQGRIEGVGGAAERLGLSPTALRRRLKAFGLR